jgi:DNA-binding beta-propeller fold protein YncE
VQALIILLSLSLFAQGDRIEVGHRAADGALVVSTGQRIQPAGKTWEFGGRLTDLAVSPAGDKVAVLHQWGVGIIDPRVRELPANWLTRYGSGKASAYHGILFSPDGRWVYASCSNGEILRLDVSGEKPEWAEPIRAVRRGQRNPVPGGLALSRDGSRLYACMASDSAVYVFDPRGPKRIGRYPVGQVPYECELSPDERYLYVTNWGGREPEEGEETWESSGVPVVVTKLGSTATGTVSIVDLSTGEVGHVAVGLHPSGMAVHPDGRLFVCNANSDTISVLRAPSGELIETIRVHYQGRPLFGSMPNDCVISADGRRLYVCDGGDNALAVFDISGRKAELKGFVPMGYYPGAIARGRVEMYVANMKGNGSVDVRRAASRFNAHDFQGTVTAWVDAGPLTGYTTQVAHLNGWEGQPEDLLRPKLKVYDGAIEHVIYIIKENRTYDQVFGDIPEGDGDPDLCVFGKEVTPNQHQLVREFALFDNAYCSGTNSADGHQWAAEALCADYLEKFYSGYVRSYPYDGDDPMAYSPAGFLWDNALDHGKTVKVYGEFCTGRVEPQPKSWTEAWQDRVSGTNKFKGVATPNIGRLKGIIHPDYIPWPLILTDQYRADVFIRDFEKMVAEGTLPNLMIVHVPCDHTEGARAGYPTPRAMVADSDLATGRIIEAVSKSPVWQESVVIMMEDDAQNGFDHIDGHRSTMVVASPYVRRGYVDSSFYNQASIIHTINLMLGLPAMNRFDAMTPPLRACFTDEPDLAPFSSVPNRIPLDELNPETSALSGQALYWALRSEELNFDEVDAADWPTLNRILWHMYKGYDTPYPFGE